MDYMTLKEASKIWGVTPRWINYYCSAGRIPGAEKMGTVWLIPKNATKECYEAIGWAKKICRAIRRRTS